MSLLSSLWLLVQSIVDLIHEETCAYAAKKYTTMAQCLTGCYSVISHTTNKGTRNKGQNEKYPSSDWQHSCQKCVCKNKGPAGEDTGAIPTFFDALEDLDELLLYRRRHKVLDENIGRIGVSISMCFSPPLHHLSSSMPGVARCPYVETMAMHTRLLVAGSAVS